MAKRSITIYSANGPMLAIKFNLYAGGNPARSAGPLLLYIDPYPSVCKTFNSIFDYCENAAMQLQVWLPGSRGPRIG